MVIVGEWQLFDDGVTRPIVRAKVRKGDSTLIAEDFLIDSGADRTVFRAALLEQLHISIQGPPADFTLSGIGGTRPFVLVATVIEFIRDDGGVVRVRREIAGFTDPAATDLSVLGCDVPDHFDLILSRRNEILLLALRHQYRVEQTA